MAFVLLQLATSAAAAAAAAAAADDDLLVVKEHVKLSDYRYPFNLSSTFKGSWKSSNMQTSTMKYAHGEGVVIYRLRNFLTSIPNLHFIHGQMIVRDGRYAAATDMRFKLQGLYFPLQGELLVYANTQWDTHEGFQAAFRTLTGGANASSSVVDAALNATVRVAEAETLRVEQEKKRQVTSDADPAMFMSTCDLTAHLHLGGFDEAASQEPGPDWPFREMEGNVAIDLPATITIHAVSSEGEVTPIVAQVFSANQSGPVAGSGQAMQADEEGQSSGGVARKLLAAFGGRYQTNAELVKPLANMSMSGTITSRTCDFDLDVQAASVRFVAHTHACARTRCACV